MFQSKTEFSRVGCGVVGSISRDFHVGQVDYRSDTCLGVSKFVARREWSNAFILLAGCLILFNIIFLFILLFLCFQLCWIFGLLGVGPTLNGSWGWWLSSFWWSLSFFSGTHSVCLLASVFFVFCVYHFIFFTVRFFFYGWDWKFRRFSVLIDYR